MSIFQYNCVKPDDVCQFRNLIQLFYRRIGSSFVTLCDDASKHSMIDRHDVTHHSLSLFERSFCSMVRSQQLNAFGINDAFLARDTHTKKENRSFERSSVSLLCFLFDTHRAKIGCFLFVWYAWLRVSHIRVKNRINILDLVASMSVGRILLHSNIGGTTKCRCTHS